MHDLWLGEYRHQAHRLFAATNSGKLPRTEQAKSPVEHPLRALFFAIEQRCNNPDQKNRSCNEVEEIFNKAFDWIIRHGNLHSKEIRQMEKEWRRYRDRNEESAKPATAQHREGSRDSRQDRKRPD